MQTVNQLNEELKAVKHELDGVRKAWREGLEVRQDLAKELAGLLKVKHAARRVCQTLATLQAKGVIVSLGAPEADLRALLGETEGEGNG